MCGKKPMRQIIGQSSRMYDPLQIWRGQIKIVMWGA